MRKIKLRAWDETGKKMAYNFQVDYDSENGFNNAYWEDGLAFGELPIIMQFTDFKDKNGKEIYEGDIVRVKYDEPDGDFSGATDTIVKFGKWEDQGEASVGFGFYYDSFDKENKGCNTNLLTEDEVEVIGNIYENTELIKQDAKRGKREQ